jgi:hypothetical protein
MSIQRGPPPLNIPATRINSGTLPVARGGTGLSTPGASGHVLTSDGEAWVTALPASGVDHTPLASYARTVDEINTLVGGHTINAADYSGKTLKLVATGFVDDAAVTLSVELYDVTGAEVVTTLTIATLATSTATSAGLTLTDARVYEVRIRKSGGTAADGGVLLSAALRVE